jgi:rare lipoprotein A
VVVLSRTRAVVVFALLLGACARPQPAPPAETPIPPPPPPGAAPPTPPPAAAVRQRGRVSLYGKGFAGKRTASGENFDPEALTMAHRTLAFGTRVRVTNIANQRSVDVVVNDRGPFVVGRIADVSAAAARQLGMTDDGVIDATLEVLR